MIFKELQEKTEVKKTVLTSSAILQQKNKNYEYYSLAYITHLFINDFFFLEAAKV